MNDQKYYIIPDIEAIAEVKDADQLRLHRRRIAANIGDVDALRAILGDASADFNDFYGTSDLPNLSTEDTIDSFLARFGSKNTEEDTEQNPVVPVVPVTPVFDYVSTLEATDELPAAEIPDDATTGVIDSFLEKVPSKRGKPKKEEKTEEKPSLTESFAKILIKNGNYSRALEIITEISLNNPEKSIYFADQIRFLKKIIFIQSHRH